MEMTAELAREIFRYEEGRLFWRVRANHAVYVGDEAGSNKWGGSRGRHRICFKKRFYPRARVIWMMHHGEIADGLVIDHINNDCTDDRIENLQAITQRQNTVKELGTRLLPVGVYWDRGKFRAQAFIDGKRRNLGRFKTAEEAGTAYEQAISLRVS